MFISLISYVAYRIFGPKMAKFILAVGLLILITFPIYFLFLKSPPPLPEMDLEEWWGPKHLKGHESTSIKPFKIAFDKEMIHDLKQRLHRPRTFTPPLEGIGFEYGFNTASLKSWLDYWADEYPFEERQKFLNQYPQFKTSIQGLNIHFIRVTPKVPAGVETVPLLLLHGWPGSVREFYEAIPLLTAVSKDRDFALELIIPSLPGYGFSDAAVRPGLGATEMAVVFKNLMKRLGFKKYYVQGGDWGAVIGSSLVTLFPDEVLGFHTNMAFAMSPQSTIIETICSLFPSLLVEPELTSRVYPLKNRYAKLMEMTGYMHIQATKPDTVGIALTDSPAGFLAYILEKFAVWTRKEFNHKEDGGLPFRFTREKLVDNLMMYWSSGSITTSMRLYAESFNSKLFERKIDEIPTKVPTWAFQTANEIAYQPPFLLKFKYPNLVHATVLQDGGHFLALELPQVFSEDVLKAIKTFRNMTKGVKTEL